jgi:predicted nucleic acid-binding protein
VNPVLLDTGPIVALLDRSEKRHRECADLITRLDAPFVTCEAVIAEACYLLRAAKGAAEAVLENVERGNFLIPYRITGRGMKLAKLIKKYADRPMDFADACLVDMATELGCGRILTLDADFRIYRWGRNRPFELLLDL